MDCSGLRALLSVSVWRSTSLGSLVMVSAALSLIAAPQALAQIPAPFVEHFADNSAGWLLGPEWQIGPATAGSPPAAGNPDPALDFTPGPDNGIAGMIIGGNVSTSLHPYYYLESPAVDTTAIATVELRFRRWLNADYLAYMQSDVEVWNGFDWVVIWQTEGEPNVFDATWTLQTFDITAHSNSQLRVRFGLRVGAAGAFSVSGWNLDDVEIVGGTPSVTSPTSALITATGATPVSYTHLTLPTNREV